MSLEKSINWAGFIIVLVTIIGGTAVIWHCVNLGLPIQQAVGYSFLEFAGLMLAWEKRPWLAKNPDS